MSAAAGLWLALAVLLAPETVTGIRVHGNHTTPDAEVIRLSGLEVGQMVTSTLVADAQARLDRSGRFRRADVLKRYASLADSTAVVVVIVVEEHLGISIESGESIPRPPSPLERLGDSFMLLPVLRWDDGYGFTYGARVSFVDLVGQGTRISTPLTWGGERRAFVEVEGTFARGPVTRLEVAGGIRRREHPTDDTPDRRTEVSVRAERALGRSVRVGARGLTSEVTFGGTKEPMRAVGVEAVVDTRRDPAFPRNAVYAAARWERLWFGTSPDTVRTDLDLRGFVSLGGARVLAVRGLHEWAADALPRYEQPLLGGTSSLRGFPLGYRVGDRLAAASAEIRLPISSPRRFGRMGVALFADTGAVYPARAGLSDAVFDTGLGAGVFLQAPLISLRLDVARGLGSATRAHFTLGAVF